HEVWQGREEPANFDVAAAHCVDDWSHLATKIDHHEVGMRWNVMIAECVEFRGNSLLNFSVQRAPATDVIRILQTREGSDERHDVHTVPYLMRSHRRDIST